jgi:hypothetical protein
VTGPGVVGVDPPAALAWSTTFDESSQTTLVPSVVTSSGDAESCAMIHGWHWPAEQVPCKQLRPHAPQLLASVPDTLMHAPEQSANPVAQLHLPLPSQTMFVPHVVPEDATGLEHMPVVMSHEPTV